MPVNVYTLKPLPSLSAVTVPVVVSVDAVFKIQTPDPPFEFVEDCACVYPPPPPPAPLFAAPAVDKPLFIAPFPPPPEPPGPAPALCDPPPPPPA